MLLHSLSDGWQIPLKIPVTCTNYNGWMDTSWVVQLFVFVRVCLSCVCVTCQSHYVPVITATCTSLSNTDIEVSSTSAGIREVAEAVTHARFVGTNSASDEVVLMRILRVCHVAYLFYMCYSFLSLSLSLSLSHSTDVKHTTVFTCWLFIDEWECLWDNAVVF